MHALAGRILHSESEIRVRSIPCIGHTKMDGRSCLAVGCFGRAGKPADRRRDLRFTAHMVTFDICRRRSQLSVKTERIGQMRKAKILATLGPASKQRPIIESMLNAGLNAVRINMSHGTQEEHTETIRIARATAADLGKPLSVLVDLSGPKIRTRTLDGGFPVILSEGEKFVLTTRDIPGSDLEVSTNFDHLPDVVEAGTRILIDDGSIELVVESKTETDVICRIV